jgi:hypothetical protein
MQAAFAVYEVLREFHKACQHSHKASACDKQQAYPGVKKQFADAG